MGGEVHFLCGLCFFPLWAMACMESKHRSVDNVMDEPW